MKTPDQLRIETLKGALTVLLEQVYQMQGMFSDEDGSIAAAIEDAETALDDCRYFATYKIPLTPKSKLTYWKAKDSDEALGLAFSHYKTIEFNIDESDRASYEASPRKGN